MSAQSFVQLLVELPDILDADYSDSPDLSTPDRLTIALCAIRDCRADLATLYKRVEQDLLAVAGEKRFVVEGVGEVEVAKKTKRTAWNHQDLVAAVVSRIMDEPSSIYDEDGTLLPYAQIGLNVARKLNACISFGAGKVTGMRLIGLQPDEFCIETPDGFSVKLPPRSAT